jgi:hypothetical protein
MAAVIKVRKVANPLKYKRKAWRAGAVGGGRPRKHTPRRRMTAKQIRFFGTKRQRAALKGARKSKQVRRVHRPSAKRQQNPVLAVTLGTVNPRRRRAPTMAKARKRRRRAVSAPVRRRRSNPRRVSKRTYVSVQPSHRRRRSKAANPRRRRHNAHRRRSNVRRNPALFGYGRATDMVKLVGGGLVGVTAVKMAIPMVPAQFRSNPIMQVLASGALAWGAGWLAGKVDKTFGEAVLFGGLMQTGSFALNAFVPQVGRTLALSGMGDLVRTTGFAVPSNPVRPFIQAPPPRINASGLARAYPLAY